MASPPSHPTVFNLLANLPTRLPAEEMRDLAAWQGVRIERILSTGQASPPGFWYDQADDEWVVLLKGAARLRFADPDAVVDLSPGDSLWISAGRRHRVEWTDPEATTVWLAVFVGEPGNRGAGEPGSRGA